ncbi:MAG: serine hydrolase domain-containing protein, partial [Vicinamibacterales bacterium]
YGLADLEQAIAIDPGMIFRIGSVTKQFTSASILLLVEQGKLSLDDPLTKYLPDYPTQGHTITIRRLLDHSSGIRGYTEMPAFGVLIPQRLPRDTLVKLFSREPFKFKPGDALAYNNSAYFLLGLVIEKVSGKTYGDFVKENLFDKAGMVDSRYCSERDIIKRRAHGYEFNQNRLVLKAHLDHTWPYAAGSLCSTAWDLMAWSQALHGGKLLTPASYRLMTTPMKLNDGTPVRYAMGLVNDSLGGRHAITHGGGINGFLTEMAYFPDDQLTIAVLVNTAGPVSPTAVLTAITDLVHGRHTPPASMALDHPAADYAGTFRGVGRGDSLTITVSSDSTGLRFRIANAPQPGQAARYVGGDVFVIGRNRFAFLRVSGRVSALRADLVSVVTRLARIN